MVKAVRISIDTRMLQEALGIQTSDIGIYHAQIDNSSYGMPMLEIYLTGEGLSDTFIVSEGDRVKRGEIILHNRIIESEIREV